MKKEELKKLLGVEVEDGILEKVIENMNTSINNAVAKQKPDMDKLKTEARESAVNDFIKGQSIKDVENVDQFVSHVKNLGSGSTELTEKSNRYKKERDDFKAQFDGLTTSNKELNTKYTSLERKGKIVDAEFNSNRRNVALLQTNEFAKEIAGGSPITDEIYAEAIEKTKTDYPDWLGGTKEPKKTNFSGKTPAGNKIAADDAETKKWLEEAGV